MLASVLVVLGGTFGATLVVGTTAVFISKIKNNIASKKSNLEKTKDVESKKRKVDKKKVVEEPLVSKREETLAILKKRLETINSYDGKIEEEIIKKVESMKLDPDTEEHKKLLVKGLKSKWVQTTTPYKERLQNFISICEDEKTAEEKVESIYNSVSTANEFSSPEVFIEKCKTYISSVSSKYKYYVDNKPNVDMDLFDKEKALMLKNSFGTAKETVIKGFESIEEKIVDSSVKVNTFKADVNYILASLKDAIESINTFKKLRDHDLLIVKTANEELKELKAALKNIENKLKSTVTRKELEVAKQEALVKIKENKDKLDLVNIDKIYKTIRSLQKKFNVSMSSLEEEMKNLIDLKVREVKENVSKRIKHELNVAELLSLKDRVEQLEQISSKVDYKIDVKVKEEIASMKNSINKGLSTRIGIVLKKKLKYFDEKHKEEIITFAIDEVKKIIPEELKNKITDDELIEKIIDVINSEYKFTKIQ